MRLDAALVELGLARSRGHAAELIREGHVSVAEQVVRRPATDLPAGERPTLDRADHYVSRAAEKLLGVLDDTGVGVPRRVLDAGSSTGGFTQVLLERGAERVFAVDVGTDQLHPSLRTDPRVVVHERTNLRELTLEHTDGEPVELIVADVSFISLRLLLGPLCSVLSATGEALLLVKPQFEVGRERLGKAGVVREEALRQQAVDRVQAAAEAYGRTCRGRFRSRLPGPSGNVEYFLWVSG
ncbi:TlyA family rRNA (cytidine-2'-O)-methyltransferase [Enemella dayhoffiae]|uniref:TlyA family rRNA (Cytidine-2'-O)-methyltransferase n=1 Tax=Enemella dayhoffiae TaxID=2016507 RepID=A0A255H380_9ACTN|nr:TlyA family RNA methyltransferase [Enemella dayhoffiae]OYO22110.1 TlyA family rRNA (cytidine-2'-O)-methyltransferase [Enemella dayhoffiae]